MITEIIIFLPNFVIHNFFIFILVSASSATSAASTVAAAAGGGNGRASGLGQGALLALLEARVTDLCAQLDLISPAIRDSIFLV